MLDYYEVYLPREDTYLVEKALSKFDLKNKRILEIGTGSGYLSIFCAKKGARVTAVDLNNKSITYAKGLASKKNLDIDFFQSNMFDRVNPKAKFDIIFFNPPYLVSDNLDYLALDGGKDGREVIDKFLTQFDEYLTEDGFVLLLHTDYNNLDKTKAILKEKQFSVSILEKQHIFFEDLYVLKIDKANKNPQSANSWL